MNIATLISVGSNVYVVWEFGAGVLGVYMLGAILIMGVEAIKRFLDI
jgi:hypothetical protein